jgi:hypothetical protein
MTPPKTPIKPKKTMDKPIAPKLPTKPTEPNKYLSDGVKVIIHNASTPLIMALNKIKKQLPPELKFDLKYVRITQKLDDNFYLGLEYTDPEAKRLDPAYEKRHEQYVMRLKRYEISMRNYNSKLAEYEAKLQEYNEQARQEEIKHAKAILKKHNAE